ncbi:hypothetical protein OSB04_013743, partial [Centaurea solstitialis]
MLCSTLEPQSKTTSIIYPTRHSSSDLGKSNEINQNPIEILYIIPTPIEIKTSTPSTPPSSLPPPLTAVTTISGVPDATISGVARFSSLYHAATTTSPPTSNPSTISGDWFRRNHHHQRLVPTQPPSPAVGSDATFIFYILFVVGSDLITISGGPDLLRLQRNNHRWICFSFFSFDYSYASGFDYGFMHTKCCNRKDEDSKMLVILQHLRGGINGLKRLENRGQGSVGAKILKISALDDPFEMLLK